MFIKVHDYEDGEPTYLNTDHITAVCVENGQTEITLVDESYYTVKEPIDKLMKIIGYFKVGESND